VHTASLSPNTTPPSSSDSSANYKGQLLEAARAKKEDHTVFEFRTAPVAPFSCEVFYRGKLIGSSSGHSKKKDAEQAASQKALIYYSSL